jgi:very-short-patch-repair endonuclease
MKRPTLFITRGQRVDPQKLELARQFRGEPTVGERALWQVLKGGAFRGLYFRRQQVMSGFIVDFYCAGARLAIELDGPIHDEQVAADQERDRALSNIGIRTVRIATDRVQHDLPTVLEEIAVACGGTQESERR